MISGQGASPHVASGLYIDFHAHVQGRKEVMPGQRPEHPWLTAAADALEPLLYKGVQLFAEHGRHRLLTQLYPTFKSWGFNEIVRQFQRHQAEELLSAMDEAGIATTVICAIEPFFETLDLLEALAPFGDRFVVFASVDPQDPEYAEVFEAYLSTGRVKGLKIHPALAGPKPTAKRMFQLVELAQRHALPVIIHTGTFPFPLVEGCDNPLMLEPVIQAFPGVDFVLAHIGWDQYRHVLDLGARYPHVHTDTSWQPPRIIREALAAFGPERLLLGSDFPLFPPKLAVEALQAAVSPEHLHAIGYANGARLLKLGAKRPVGGAAA